MRIPDLIAKLKSRIGAKPAMVDQETQTDLTIPEVDLKLA